MTVQPPVRQETKRIAIGTLILTAVMLIVAVILGWFDRTVLFGALFGAAYAVLNFFLMALTVQQAADQMNGVQLPEKEEEADNSSDDMPVEELPQQKNARRIVQRSYYLRMALTAVMAIVAVKVPLFNPVPALAAQFFPRIVITLQPLIQKLRKEE